MDTPNIMDTTGGEVAEKPVTSCVSCAFLHVLRDQLLHEAK